MGWLRLVGFLKSQVSFAEYPLFCRALLQKRPIILRSLLIVATPYQITSTSATHCNVGESLSLAPQQYAATYRNTSTSKIEQPLSLSLSLSISLSVHLSISRAFSLSHTHSVSHSYNEHIHPTKTVQNAAVALPSQKSCGFRMLSRLERDSQGLCCTVLHCVAVCCIVLQCVAVCCNVSIVLQCVYCNALQRTATHCNTLQHTATH